MSEQKPGDIILVNGANKNSLGIRAFQRVKTGMKASYSHVVFCLGSGDIIHSDMKGGVHRLYIDDLLSECKPNWLALRNTHISKIPYQDILEKSIYYQQQSYNKLLIGLFGGQTPEDASFCSQLVSLIIKDLNVEVDLPDCKKTLPVHFQHLIEKNGWDDVTREHEEAISIYSRIPNYRESIDKSIQMSKELQGNTVQTLEDYHALKGLIKDLPLEDLGVEFWNAKKVNV